ncbi:hypothetical protein I546_6028 [Mycobacterium kansasii 732]|nr:hypothetical protein I546_6028 [Mycobacterium kansasii 732]
MRHPADAWRRAVANFGRKPPGMAPPACEVVARLSRVCRS